MLPRNEYQARTLHDSGDESSWVQSWKEVLKAAEQDSTKITGTLVKETLSPDTENARKTKVSSKDVVVKVLGWIDEKMEEIDSVEAAKELLAKIEKELKKLKN